MKTPPIPAAPTAAVAFTLFAAASPAAFEIREEPGKHIDVLDGDRVVARVMTAHDLSTEESRHETYKVYTHVFAPDGSAPITKGAGGQFTHHRGIFLGWSKTRFDGRGVDTWHMKGCTQQYQRIVAQEAGDDGAALSILVHWVADDGTVFVEETRNQVFKRLEGGDGAYLQVDVDTALKAVGADVELNGDPEHAGCQFRPSQTVAENKSAKYLFHEEGVDPKKVKDLPWVAESFQIGDARYYAQHMSHPTIPEGNTYSAYRDYGRFGAYFVSTIKEGEVLPLRYRIVVGEGAMPEREAFAARYSAFAE